MLKRIILFALIFNLPFQLGLHFWPAESFVKSFRIDYLSPTLYLTDILMAAFFLSRFREVIKLVADQKNRKLILVYLSLVILNLLAASFSLVTLYGWVRVTAYLLLFILLRATPDLAKKVALPFTISLLIVLVIALAQFVRQSSLGGIFYFFGERSFSTYTPNVAKIETSLFNLPFLSGDVVRPYSTFSHPNSLAGYLLIAFLIIPLLGGISLHRWLVFLVILLTFSKSAFLAFVSVFIFETTLLQNIILTFFLTVLPLADWISDIPLWLEKSFQSRRELLEGGFKVIKENFITGTGLRQFIPELSQHLPASRLSYQTLQPIHNFALLALAELGVVGLALVDYLVAKFFIDLAKKENFRTLLFQLLSLVLLTGSLDHYWWTLPQNQLIIVLGLALLTNESTPLEHALRKNHH